MIAKVERKQSYVQHNTNPITQTKDKQQHNLFIDNNDGLV